MCVFGCLDGLLQLASTLGRGFGIFTSSNTVSFSDSSKSASSLGAGNAFVTRVCRIRQPFLFPHQQSDKRPKETSGSDYVHRLPQSLPSSRAFVCAFVRAFVCAFVCAFLRALRPRGRRRLDACLSSAC